MGVECTVWLSRLGNGVKEDVGAVDDDLAGMFKVHRDAGVDHRLHLAQAPIGLVRVAHDHARFQIRVFHSHQDRPLNMQDKPDLAALIGSRICHDLISPIGAIGNGVELMMMDGAAQTPELALIAESVASANARIRFFRVAFGAASGDQRIARGEVAGILADLTRGGRLTVEWLSPADLSRPEVKLVFLLLQCLESAMAYGGKVRIERGDGGWVMHAEAPRLKIDPALWEVLTERHAPPEIAAGQVHFALVPDTLKAQGRRLVAELRETEIRLSF